MGPRQKKDKSNTQNGKRQCTKRWRERRKVEWDHWDLGCMYISKYLTTDIATFKKHTKKNHTIQ